ncbi:MAG TPA: NUDIX domain-containing protein [Gaiellales bacterium]|nr:NUDIX domain-containing protein [Gaiellales bacterium]
MLDAEGREIGSAPRKACHSDPSLIHPSVHVVVVTGSGCLWQLRGYGKDSAPGFWDHACSGHVSLGEDARTAAVRELAEEIGVEVDDDALVRIDRLLCDLGNETELTTVFRLEHDGPFTLRLPELAGLAVLPRGQRPEPLSPSALLLSARLDAERPGWDG